MSRYLPWPIALLVCGACGTGSEAVDGDAHTAGGDAMPACEARWTARFRPPFDESNSSVSTADQDLTIALVGPRDWSLDCGESVFCTSAEVVWDDALTDDFELSVILADYQPSRNGSTAGLQVRTADGSNAYSSLSAQTAGPLCYIGGRTPGDQRALLAGSPSAEALLRITRYDTTLETTCTTPSGESTYVFRDFSSQPVRVGLTLSQSSDPQTGESRAAFDFFEALTAAGTRSDDFSCASVVVVR